MFLCLNSYRTNYLILILLILGKEKKPRYYYILIVIYEEFLCLELIFILGSGVACILRPLAILATALSALSIAFLNDRYAT